MELRTDGRTHAPKMTELYSYHPVTPPISEVGIFSLRLKLGAHTAAGLSGQLSNGDDSFTSPTGPRADAVRPLSRSPRDSPSPQDPAVPGPTRRAPAGVPPR